MAAPGEVIKDAGLAGFGVRRQGAARVYIVRKDVDGRRHSVSIGALSTQRLV
jgi:hypothetical protein